ncbi:MAG: Glycosyl transferase family 2 [Parcubacteria group bacterium GW2011_GWA2_47_16]|nr:MAG: Glycosyl transferase family 2 [Parcubacteria group bacterium GW2011_GWA2_47_16]
MPKLSIVIPIYNEEKTLREILRRVFEVRISGWEIEIIAVDDASTDKTPQILEENKTRLKIHRHLKNQGKGSAVKNGLALASGNFLIIQDADLEYDPKEIPTLVAAVKDNRTIVYGSRNLHHVKRKGFLVQRYGTWVTTKLVNMLYGANLTDVWTCYKVFPSEAKPLYLGGKFESDIIFLVRTLRLGYRVIERPISHAPRGADEGKKIRYRDGIQALLLIIGDRLGHLRKEAEVKAKDASLFIVDPEEHLPLKREGNVLVARNGTRYSIDASGRPYLMPEASISEFDEEHQSGINWLKSFFKQFPILYYGIWHFFCPVLMLVNGPRGKLKKYVPAGTAIVDIGSGPRRFGPEFINLDIFPFLEVDIVADAAHLPFANNSIPALVSEAVLEHVENTPAVTSELVRVLKSGGFLYVSIPFMTPYHASPDDFTRWTISGLKSIFKDLEIVESGVRSGPASAILMFLVYWLGVIFSFGSKKTAPFITHVLMLVVGPLKFLDFLFYWMPGADTVAAHLYIVARKK